MDDLVDLRNLIRSTSARDQSVNTDSLSRQVAFECQFECIITRATSAGDIKTMELTPKFLWARSIFACAGAADSPYGFTRWYTRILRTVVHIDVRTNEFAIFHRAMQAIYRLAKAHISDANPHCRCKRRGNGSGCSCD